MISFTSLIISLTILLYPVINYIQFVIHIIINKMIFSNYHYHLGRNHIDTLYCLIIIKSLLGFCTHVNEVVRSRYILLLKRPFISRVMLLYRKFQFKMILSD